MSRSLSASRPCVCVPPAAGQGPLSRALGASRLCSDSFFGSSRLALCWALLLPFTLGVWAPRRRKTRYLCKNRAPVPFFTQMGKDQGDLMLLSLPLPALRTEGENYQSCCLAELFQDLEP